MPKKNRDSPPYPRQRFTGEFRPAGDDSPEKVLPV
jgi:hypothetical protein